MTEYEDDDPERPGDEGPHLSGPFAGSEDDASEDGSSEDDASEDDLDSPAGADAEARPPPRTRRRGLGPMLLGVGGGIWALVAIMRCDGPQTEVPSLAVDNDASGAPAETQAKQASSPPAANPPSQPAHKSAPPVAAQPADVDPGSVPPPRPAPAAWVANVAAPDVVRYTIRRGGSAENVANLFKIFHHEILELNPGIELKQELPPNTKLVVFRRDENEVSESVGLPSGGSLEGGIPMAEGPGRELKAIPWKSWGSASTVAILDHILRDWADRGHRQPVLVGNMASRSGGRLPPHSTHQSGRDVDLGYPQKLQPGVELNWVNINETNLDPKSTWDLLFSLARSGMVEIIYADRGIQKLLYEYAIRDELMPKSKLAGWMEYPRATGSGNPLIQHVQGHVDHLHARFRCQAHEKRCKSRRR